VCIVYLQGEDPARSIATLAALDHPFDRWFKQEVKRLHGIDFNQPPASPLREVVYESGAGRVRLMGIGAI
jgi:hypothetical protein